MHLQKPLQKGRVQYEKIQKIEVEGGDATLAHQVWLAMRLLQTEGHCLLAPKEIGLIRKNKTLWYGSS